MVGGSNPPGSTKHSSTRDPTLGQVLWLGASSSHRAARRCRLGEDQVGVSRVRPIAQMAEPPPSGEDPGSTPGRSPVRAAARTLCECSSTVEQASLKRSLRVRVPSFAPRRTCEVSRSWKVNRTGVPGPVGSRFAAKAVGIVSSAFRASPLSTHTVSTGRRRHALLRLIQILWATRLLTTGGSRMHSANQFAAARAIAAVVETP